MAGDATRATLVALGLTLAGQACGGDADTSNERDDTGLIPPYGQGPIEVGGSGGSGGGNANGGAPGSGGDSTFPTVPPYGAAPYPGGGSGGDAETHDSGTPPDAGGDDAGGSETPDVGD
jgi:hypothetical protein